MRRAPSLEAGMPPLASLRPPGLVGIWSSPQPPHARMLRRVDEHGCPQASGVGEDVSVRVIFENHKAQGGWLDSGELLQGDLLGHTVWCGIA